MRVEGIAERGEVALDSVKHERREVGGGKVGGGEKGDLALVPSALYERVRGEADLRAQERVCVGELLVPHLHRLGKDACPGRIRRPLGVVERLGHGVAGEVEGVSYVLDGHAV